MNSLERVPDCLRDFPSKRRYLVGVSGGRDSVVLLHWLLRLGYRRLIVCHLDHQLRGAAARADARFVRRLAEKRELECEIERADIRDRAASLEAAARAARLEFFARVAKRRRCPTIFLGQHADDQVETFLMQLFRGAGGRGLGAMREVSEVGSLRIVRPFLGVWRAEIDHYIAKHRLKFREDATNAAREASRNRLRHDFIPALEKKLGRKVRQNLWRAAHVLAEENSFLETLVPNDLAEAETLSTKELQQLPLALQRRALLRWLRAHHVREVGFEVVESVRTLLEPATTVAKVNLPGDRHARRRAGVLFVD